ncbi:MAG: 2TM domain-containing protein [Synechococcales cyanobacterium T60_A2020_003]|nr:2TM domain-containing protein [Synechococcales cyanobacterium T60_A2020_003]
MADLYRQDEVQQILNIAIARQANAGELSRGQMLEIAQEMGISIAELHDAEIEWLQRQQVDRDRFLFDQHRRLRFRQRVTKYVIVNLFLIMLNLVMVGQVSWALYILVGWGLGIALHGWRTFQSQGDAYERAFATWQRQRQLKQTVGRVLDRFLNPSPSL